MKYKTIEDMGTACTQTQGPIFSLSLAPLSLCKQQSFFPNQTGEQTPPTPSLPPPSSLPLPNHRVLNSEGIFTLYPPGHVAPYSNP